MSDRLQVEAHRAFAAIDARVSFHSGSRGRVWNEAPVGDLQASALRLAAVLRGGLSQPFVLLALENSPELVLGVLACIQTGISFDAGIPLITGPLLTPVPKLLIPRSVQ